MGARHDRYGDVVEDQVSNTMPTWHSSRCSGGWLGEDDDGRPMPCPACRPNLRRHTTVARRTGRPATDSTRAAAMQTIRAELARTRHKHTGREP